MNKKKFLKLQRETITDVDLIPKDKVLEDWNEFQHLDEEGITVKEFLENQKQETLEEAAERIFDGFGDITKPVVIKRAIELVKGQQERMYSEEEVLKIIDLLFHKYASSFRVDAKEDFLLSKKK